METGKSRHRDSGVFGSNRFRPETMPEALSAGSAAKVGGYSLFSSINFCKSRKFSFKEG